MIVNGHNEKWTLPPRANDVVLPNIVYVEEYIINYGIVETPCFC
jgi:hypothetical protein